VEEEGGRGRKSGELCGGQLAVGLGAMPEPVGASRHGERARGREQSEEKGEDGESAGWGWFAIDKQVPNGQGKGGKAVAEKRCCRLLGLLHWPMATDEKPALWTPTRARGRPAVAGSCRAPCPLSCPLQLLHPTTYPPSRPVTMQPVAETRQRRDFQPTEYISIENTRW